MIGVYSIKRIIFHAVLFFSVQFAVGIALIIYRPGPVISVILGFIIAISTWALSAMLFPIDRSGDNENR